MAKIPIPFTLVTCPLCGDRFDRRLNENKLCQHIQSSHASEPIKPLVEAVLGRLNLGLPSNVDEVSREELCKFLEQPSAPIILSDLAAATQIHQKAVPREVKALTEMNIILRDPATSLTSFNPDLSTWVKRKVVAKSLRGSSSKSGNKAATSPDEHY